MFVVGILWYSLLSIRKLPKCNLNNNVVCIIIHYFVFDIPTVGTDSSAPFYRSALKCPKPNCWYSKWLSDIINWPLLNDNASTAVFPAAEQQQQQQLECIKLGNG